jgi:ParB-like chromosome segregation protein Spo0J
MSNVATIKPNIEPVVDYDQLLAHELASLMDLIEGRAFEDLKADIKKQGILTPIVLYEGKILDGRNRYRAAKAVGHKFVGANFEVFEGDLAAAEAFVFSVNAQRRQMTNAQKAAEKGLWNVFELRALDPDSSRPTVPSSPNRS